MDKIKTGIDGLDEMLEGGVFPGSSTLIVGAPGTGKTTIGIEFIYQGCIKFNQQGLIITFEYFPQSLYRDAESFGWDLKGLEEEDKLKVIFTSPEIFLRELEDPYSFLSEIIRDGHIQRVFLDSINHFQKITAESAKLREIYNRVINGLKRENLTSFISKEYGMIMAESINEENESICFIVDNLIILKFVEIESEMKKAVLILKTRGSQHIKDIKEMEITSEGIKIKHKFKGVEAIFTGMPHKLNYERIFSGRGKPGNIFP